MERVFVFCVLAYKISSQIICSSPSCAATPYGDYICTEDVTNCYINCNNADQCSGNIIRSDATNTIIYCTTSFACSSTQIICGYHNTTKSNTQCSILCQNTENNKNSLPTKPLVLLKPTYSKIVHKQNQVLKFKWFPFTKSIIFS